jgi:NAD+ synthase (glutamine-hydrolysing)
MSEFARIAAVSLRVHLGDVEGNTQEILKKMRELEAQGVQAAVFPELCITGYTLGDLLLHETVQRAAWAAMLDIAAQTRGMAVVVGLPVNVRSRLFNCAAVLQNGGVRGIVPNPTCPRQRVL